MFARTFSLYEALQVKIRYRVNMKRSYNLSFLSYGHDFISCLLYLFFYLPNFSLAEISVPSISPMIYLL